MPSDHNPSRDDPAVPEVQPWEVTGPRYSENNGTVQYDGDECLVNIAAALADIADKLLERADDQFAEGDDELVAIAGRLRRDASLLWGVVGRRLLSPYATDHVKEPDPPAPLPVPPARPTATLTVGRDAWTIRPVDQAGGGFTLLLPAEREIMFGSEPDAEEFGGYVLEALAISRGDPVLLAHARKA